MLFLSAASVPSAATGGAGGVSRSELDERQRATLAAENERMARELEEARRARDAAQAETVNPVQGAYFGKKVIPSTLKVSVIVEPVLQSQSQSSH